jgi:hypothetical protein
MGDGDFIGIFAIFCIFGLPVLAWMGTRAMAHKERMEMLRQGYAPNNLGGKQHWTPAPGPSMPSMPQNRPPVEHDWSPEAAHGALRKGITVTMIGFAITVGLSFIGYDHGSDWHPGPWLLGGLIPMFVGLAQVIIALLSGATLGPPRGWSAAPTAMPPPFYGETPSAPPPPTYDGSYTYRPGERQELRPPSSPPDRR